MKWYKTKKQSMYRTPGVNKVDYYTVESFVWISNNLFNSLIIPTVNCTPLSDIMLSRSLCNFHMWSWNNFVRLSANVFSVIVIKCTILLNWSHTTKIALYPCASGSLVMKSAKMWLYDFSRIALGINFPASALLQFLYLWQASHSSTYLPTSFITPDHQ